MRQNDGEFVSTQAGASIGGAATSLQHLGGDLQRVIAGLMSMPIVDQLEVVQIDDEEGNRAVAQCAVDLLVQGLVEFAPVIQAGEWIGDGQIVQF
jgi:hypothetical protein